MTRKVVTISGTNGLPGRYGGWDPLLNSLSIFLSSNHISTIVHTEKSLSYEPLDSSSPLLRRVIIPFSANGKSSVIYDFVCLCDSLRRRSVCLMLGTSGGLFFPLFRLLGLQIVVNVDGEEWNRSKWGFFARLFCVYLITLLSKRLLM